MLQNRQNLSAVCLAKIEKEKMGCFYKIKYLNHCVLRSKRLHHSDEFASELNLLKSGNK